MTFREKLDRAVATIKGAAESEQAQRIANKAKSAAQLLTRKAKDGALDAAAAFVEANSDPATVRVHFGNVAVNVLSPSDGVEITRPNAGTLVVADGEGNGLVINAAAEPAFVAETLGNVKQLSGSTYDLGPEDGINLIILKV
ncbi:MAG: hypothetical protein QNK18_06455 [Gammaproteobacteria bacterium]|nr:hypothetical protein [Gammaproteobacteria bacterium]MDJ0890820.1 hypothetical protein [Gammaproteobacteria bacterium]